MTKKILAIVLGLSAWIGGTVAASLGQTGTAAAQTLFKIERAHADYTPTLDGSEPIFVLLLGSDARPGEQMNRGGVPKRVWRYPLGCQPRRRSGSGADVLRELEAHARCAQGCTVAVYECRSSLACGWRSSSAESNSTVSGHSGQMRSLRPLPNRGPQSGRRSTAAATPSLQACVPSDARRRTPFGTTAPHYSPMSE